MSEAVCPAGKNSILSRRDRTQCQAYTVVLLCGGTSSERAISFASAECVERELLASGHTVVRIDTARKDFIELLKEAQPDVAFIALHGRGGEDGSLQAVLELLGIPYTGSGVLGSALSMDKYRAKLIYSAAGLNTPKSLQLKRSEREALAATPETILKDLTLPVVVKPSEDGSSVGIAIVRQEHELIPALDSAFANGPSILVEQFIEGTEITVAVIGSSRTMALPSIEIVPKNEFYDYESKYTQGGSEHILPARISAAALAEANRAALLAHDALGCFGVSRTDMIVDSTDTVWIIETNTIPGMTGTSLLPDAAEHAGINKRDLYDAMLDWALERAENRR